MVVNTQENVINRRTKKVLWTNKEKRVKEDLEVGRVIDNRAGQVKLGIWHSKQEEPTKRFH